MWHRAVLRVLARDSYVDPDLSRLLRDPATARRLVELRFGGEGGPGPGGFVHARQGGLELQIYLPSGAQAAHRELEAHQEIHPRLVASYLSRDLGTLLADLASDDVRGRLEREGVSPLEVPRLKWRSRVLDGPRDTFRLVREAGRLIQHFFPLARGGYEVTRDDQLRFYEESNPSGYFVGLVEIVEHRFGGAIPAETAEEPAGRAHYPVVVLPGGGAIEIHDYFRGSGWASTARVPWPIRPIFRCTGSTGWPRAPAQATASRRASTTEIMPPVSRAQ